MKGIWKALGSVGKGFGRIAGVALAGGGTVATLANGKGGEVAGCVKTLMDSPDSAALVTGLVVLVFGIARNAGWIGAKAATEGK